MSDVAAVVVTHGPAAELDECLTALIPAGRRARPRGEPPRARAAARRSRFASSSPSSPQGYAANANLGIAATEAPFVLLANPDTLPAADAVGLLRAFASDRPRCGIAGPQLVYEDGSWQPSRRRFPTVSGTIVRRTPLRSVLRPGERQRAHYMLDERPEEPVEADWMLGAFLLLRREMLDELGGLDPGYRLYGEDIDLCYRAAKAGWERWYVPAASRHAPLRGRDRPPLPHAGARSGTGAGSRGSCGSTPSDFERFDDCATCEDRVVTRRAVRSRSGAQSSWGTRGTAQSDGLAVPPRRLRMSVAGTADAAWFLESGRLTRQVIAQALADNGRSAGEATNILDFGCGCGRVTRHWHQTDRFVVHGTDVNRDRSHGARDTSASRHSPRNELTPPLRLEDERFDASYAISVSRTCRRS